MPDSNLEELKKFPDIGPRGRRKTYSLSDKDVELIQWIAEYLGTNQSEAVRTATRSFAAHIGTLEKKMRGES